MEVWTQDRGWRSIGFESERALEVGWENYQLRIGNAPALDLSELQPSVPQQLSLSNDQLHLENGGVFNFSNSKRNRTRNKK